MISQPTQLATLLLKASRYLENACRLCATLYPSRLDKAYARHNFSVRAIDAHTTVEG